MNGKQSGTPAFLINLHKISSKKDALDYISRLNGIRPLFEQLVKNIKENLGVEIYCDPDVNPLTDLEAALGQIAAMDLIISVSNKFSAGL